MKNTPIADRRLALMRLAAITASSANHMGGSSGQSKETGADHRENTPRNR